MMKGVAISISGRLVLAIYKFIDDVLSTSFFDNLEVPRVSKRKPRLLGVKKDLEV